MPLTIRIALAATLLLAPAAAPAQESPRYASAAVGLVSYNGQLDATLDSRSASLALAGGYAFSPMHALELGLGWYRYEVTSNAGCVPACEAPTTWGVQSVPVTLGYRFTLPVGGTLQPFLRVAGGLARVTDSWESDTPREETVSTVFTGTADAGATVRLRGPLSVLFAAGYRHVEEERSDRRGLDLSGPLFTFGLQFGR